MLMCDDVITYLKGMVRIRLQYTQTTEMWERKVGTELSGRQKKNVSMQPVFLITLDFY